MPQQENELLIEQFSESEVRAAIFQMEHNKAPGPDGFPPEFYLEYYKRRLDVSLFQECLYTALTLEL